MTAKTHNARQESLSTIMAKRRLQKAGLVEDLLRAIGDAHHDGTLRKLPSPPEK